jgi:hypothetical protein
MDGDTEIEVTTRSGDPADVTRGAERKNSVKINNTNIRPAENKLVKFIGLYTLLDRI